MQKATTPNHKCHDEFLHLRGGLQTAPGPRPAERPAPAVAWVNGGQRAAGQSEQTHHRSGEAAGAGAELPGRAQITGEGMAGERRVV